MATQHQTSSSSIDAAANPVIALLVAYVVLPVSLIILGAAALYSYLLRRRPIRNITTNGHKMPNDSARSGGAASESENGPLLDVWAERERRGIGPATSSRATTSSRSDKGPRDDKPFGSKYYYAHNNPNSTGGYKDGLRMEDYTMNGPRLLARNGLAMPSGMEETVKVLANTKVSAAGESIEGGVESMKKVKRRVLPVTQYLWDDPGKGSGTIRVDQLPHPNKPGEKRSWKESGVESVLADLISDGCGLEVVMESFDDAGVGIEYRLTIPKLYGPVSAVSAVTKPSRLLIKLEKKTSLLDRSNAKPWPHPQKKLL